MYIYLLLSDILYICLNDGCKTYINGFCILDAYSMLNKY